MDTAESRRVLHALRALELLPLEPRCPHGCPACREAEDERQGYVASVLAAQEEGITPGPVAVDVRAEAR